MTQPSCTHCGGLHYGSLPGECVFICENCGCDIRPDAHPRCACPKELVPGFYERLRQINEQIPIVIQCPTCRLTFGPPAIAGNTENYRRHRLSCGVPQESPREVLLEP